MYASRRASLFDRNPNGPTRGGEREKKMLPNVRAALDVLNHLVKATRRKKAAPPTPIPLCDRARLWRAAEAKFLDAGQTHEASLARRAAERAESAAVEVEEPVHAAAPDLLAAAVEAEDKITDLIEDGNQYDDKDHPLYSVRELLRAAIAKAEGEPTRA